MTGYVDRWEFTSAEIAEAVGRTQSTIKKRAKGEGWAFREEPAQGGARRLYLLDALPEDAKLAIIARQQHEAAQAKARTQAADTELQARIKAQCEALLFAKGHRKKEAERRHAALLAVEHMRRDTGASLSEARRRVATLATEAGEQGRSVKTLKRYAALVRDIPRAYWLAFLLPDETGSAPPLEIHPATWEAFKRDYGRVEQPDAAACYRRLRRRAQVNPEWGALPSLKTLQRRWDALPATERVGLREGLEALERMGPPIRRDYSTIAAMEIVNADGHVFDVFVKWPDGSIGRPVVVGWQDVYSKKILAYRVGRSETAELVRLSYCDMVREYGIPQHAHLDNGRAFAAKSNTGGMATRYRFKVRPEDPAGVFGRMGTEVHWVTPYNGKAKPIERAWRDLATDIAKRPEYAGAYVGNSPGNKPANYGAHAVLLDVFLRVLADGVAEYNAREERTSEVAAGRSFDAVFSESYARSTITRATRDQLAMMLLASEAVTIARNGHIRFARNLYWDEATAMHAGERVELRFDPDALHEDVHVFALDGSYIAKVPCTHAHGWGNTEAMQAAIKRQRDWNRKSREFVKAEAERDAHIQDALPPIAGPELPPPAAVRMLNPPRKPTAAERAEDAAHDEAFTATVLRMVRARDGF